MKVISEEVEEERKKEVVCEVRVYNSLHWWVSLSELSEKIMQAMKKKISPVNLVCTKWTNTC